MKTKTIELYSFDELSEEAKQKAIENVRLLSYEDPFDYLSNEAMNTIKKGLDAFNCELKNWSIDFQNANRSDFKINFSVDNLEEVQNFSPIRLRTWLINNFYGVLYEYRPQGEYRKVGENWRYKRRSKIQITETDLPFTGVCYDFDFLDVFRKFLKSPDRSDFKEMINSAVYNVIRSVESEIEYRLSDKGIIEEIEANEYTFTSSGKLENI